MATCSVDTSRSALQRSASAIPFDRSPPGQRKFPIDLTSLKPLDLGVATPIKSRKVTVMTPKPGMEWNAKVGAVMKDGTQISPSLNPLSGDLKDLKAVIVARRKEKAEAAFDQAIKNHVADKRPDGTWITTDSYGNIVALPIPAKETKGPRLLAAEEIQEAREKQGFPRYSDQELARYISLRGYGSRIDLSAAAARAGDECKSGQG